jgi:hypothetical protein
MLAVVQQIVIHQHKETKVELLLLEKVHLELVMADLVLL